LSYRTQDSTENSWI